MQTHSGVYQILGNFLHHEEAHASKGLIIERINTVLLNTSLCQIKLTAWAYAKKVWDYGMW